MKLQFCISVAYGPFHSYEGNITFMPPPKICPMFAASVTGTTCHMSPSLETLRTPLTFSSLTT